MARDPKPKTKTHERIEIALGFFLFFAVTGAGVFSFDRITVGMEAVEVSMGMDKLVKNLRGWKEAPTGEATVAALHAGLVPDELAHIDNMTVRIRMAQDTLPPMIEVSLGGLEYAQCQAYLQRTTRGVTNQRDLYAIWIGSAGVTLINFPLIPGFSGCSPHNNVARFQYRLTPSVY